MALSARLLLAALAASLAGLAAGSIYEEFPFPPQTTTREEAFQNPERVGFVGPSYLPEIEHFVFGGRLPRGRPLRVLLAGGGTGDLTLPFVLSLARLPAGATVYHMDPSMASLKEAQRLYGEYGVDYVKLVQSTIEELNPLHYGGRMDYIDCTGVVHHTADPSTSMAALARMLKMDVGGMGLMVYGAVGRASVYQLREMVALMGVGDDSQQQLDALWALGAGLPESNWHQHVLRRKAGQEGPPSFMDVAALPRTDAVERVVMDAFLHPQDVAYKVPEVYQLLAGARLRLTGWPQRAWYEPASYLEPDSPLLPQLQALPDERRLAVGELLAGSISLHEVYAVSQFSQVQLPHVLDEGAVLVPRRRLDWFHAVADQLLQVDPALEEKAVFLERHGAMMRLQLRHPHLAGRILQLLGGEVFVRQLREALQAPPQFDEAMEALFDALHAHGYMMLRLPPV